ncbi:MAG: hypothetical protein FWE41_01740 [Coriobacteriia bacterium]|nr:hypothetical protein [Coriobacteriia bacterium]MCL2750491.1 hypothetical protein [Coriobacteriia bacterium]
MTEDHIAEGAELNEADALDKIVLFALDEAMEKFEQSGELEPFTVVLHGDNLHIESHPGEDAAECFNAASQAVQNLAHVMQAYVFAYDGYITTDEGTRDALIAERGTPESDRAEAFAILYTLDEEGDGSLTFEDGIYDLGSATTLLGGAVVTSDDLDEI